MKKTLPRGLCIRRKDKNRKQSRSKYIRIRIPRHYHSFGASTDIPASHHSFARKVPESRRIPSTSTDTSVGALAPVGLPPNRRAEVISSQPAAPRSFAPQIARLPDYQLSWLSKYSLGDADHARRIRAARLTDAVPSALRRRESRPIPAGNTAASAGTNHS
ncbi:hypothetical protein N431DRAFT_490971 [Stipitochalara longipes BDJ]|nr:hypothetical protein N431DRAFT_490971 [Stipitochalara longipes BDJ]